MVWPVDPARFVAFLGVTTALSLAPGPAVLFCIANGARSGAGAVGAGVLGITLAGLVWFSGAALGLGALMAAAPWVFRPLSLVGLGYLCWLGARAVAAGLSRTSPQAATSDGETLRLTRGGLLQHVGRGLVVQLTNPKTLLYFSGVLPPFLDPRRPLVPQLVMIGSAALLIDATMLQGYGLGGAALASRLRDPRGARLFALASGALLLTAAGLIAIRL